MFFGLEGEIDVVCVCCFVMDVLRGGGVCWVGLLFFFTALTGFRRNGVFGESVLEIVWGRDCSFVWGWFGSDGIIVDDCGVAELAIDVVCFGVLG